MQTDRTFTEGLENKPVAPKKDRVVDSLSGSGSALQKYQDFFVGSRRLTDLLRYELAIMLAVPMSGALGFGLRKNLLPGLFRSVGPGVNFGRNLSLRCPRRITVGAHVAIDDNCALDARGAVPDATTGPRGAL